MKIVSKSRLEAFSDGVFAIIITIIVLELSMPNQQTWSAIVSSGWIWKFMAYVISFLLTASFWISHHNIINSVHPFTLVKRVDHFSNFINSSGHGLVW